MALFLIGAVTMRAAGCVINDLWDRDIDKKIARTATRPLASGNITLTRAGLLLFCLGMIGLAILLQLPMKAWLMGCASLPLIASYPLFKRFTYWPQAMLGLTFSWGIFLGYVAATDSWPNSAMKDMADDAKTGVKSSALALAGRISFAVKRLYAFALILLTAGFYLHFMHFGIWTIGICLMGLHLYRQTSLIEEDNPYRALQLFRSNRDAGLFLTAGLLMQFAL